MRFSKKKYTEKKYGAIHIYDKNTHIGKIHF